jgi:uncharacterized protein involved in exopolysaccharide biosynthesis
MIDNDEIYLIDMWRIFVREWRWFVLVLAIVLACTFAFSYTAKRQWEATAWIQIGQIGQLPQGQDPKIEPIFRVMERMQTVMFQDDVLKHVGLAPTAPEAQLYRKSLKLEPSPYAGMIKLSVRATSPQQANQLATATATRLHEIHQGIEAIPLRLAHARLDEVQGELQTARVDRDRLLQTVTPGNTAVNSTLASVMLASKNQEIHDLQQTESDILLHLSPSQTYETSLLWPVYVPDNQVFPNPALTWGIGTLFGIFLGAFAAMARNAARRAPRRRHPMGR